MATSSWCPPTRTHAGRSSAGTDGWRARRSAHGSRAGALSFNWRLLLAPEEVLDYVIWHEVCHLAVPDHSPRFWALVADHCPDHRERAAWLRANAATLVL